MHDDKNYLLSISQIKMLLMMCIDETTLNNSFKYLNIVTPFPAFQ